MRDEETTAHVGRILDHREIDGDDMECIYLALGYGPVASFYERCAYSFAP
jgi:hypothetical protein